MNNINNDTNNILNKQKKSEVLHLLNKYSRESNCKMFFTEIFFYEDGVSFFVDVKTFGFLEKRKLSFPSSWYKRNILELFDFSSEEIRELVRVIYNTLLDARKKAIATLSDIEVISDLNKSSNVLLHHVNRVLGKESAVVAKELKILMYMKKDDSVNVYQKIEVTFLYDNKEYIAIYDNNNTRVFPEFITMGDEKIKNFAFVACRLK